MKMQKELKQFAKPQARTLCQEKSGLKEDLPLFVSS
jgi:hypothetical protein